VQTIKSPEKSAVIYHNPRCSKSRDALKTLQEHEYHVTIADYLTHPPGRMELNNILKMLGLEPREAMRTKEALYKDLNLADTSLSRMDLITAMSKNPILIERPIIVINDKAIIARPPEKLSEIME
jgi:arsenate reductase